MIGEVEAGKIVVCGACRVVEVEPEVGVGMSRVDLVRKVEREGEVDEVEVVRMMKREVEVGVLNS